MDRAQRNWLRELEERLRAAHAHDVAADLSARMRDYARAAAESELAEAERTAHAAALAELVHRVQQHVVGMRRALDGELPSGEVASFLSGLLIGSDIAGALDALASSIVARARWSALVIGVLIALQMTPTATAVIPLFRVLAALHLLDRIPGVALAIAATTLPYAILLLRPFFRSVPVEVEEAARMDGAGEITCFLRVVLPLVRNGVSLITVLLLIGSWGEFLYSVSFLSTSSKYPLSVLLVQQQGFYGTQYNNLMALALISSLPTIILFTVVARRMTGGLALGVGK